MAKGLKEFLSDLFTPAGEKSWLFSQGGTGQTYSKTPNNYQSINGNTGKFNTGNFSGGGVHPINGTITTTPRTTGGGGGYNWGPQIAALKKSGEQNLPSIINQYNNSIGDQIATNNAYHDMGDQAKQQAKENYLMQNANQRGIVDDIWYYNTQKFQNSRMQHEDAINTQYGSIFQRMNDLYNKLDDQLDQTNLGNLKQGLFQNGTEYANSINNTNQSLAENDIQTYAAIRDILSQGGAALTNYANSILDSLSGYGDREYRDANGNITAAGWNYLRQYGIVNNGSGGFEFNYNLFSPNPDGTWGSAGESMDEYLQKLRESRPEYYTTDYLPMIRSAQETRKYVQHQSDRNYDEALKNGKMSAHDYTEYITRRYG